MVNRFLIITTNDLPEAYFLVKYLLDEGQHVSVLNFTGRSIGDNFRILRRLRRRHGWIYIFDFLLGKILSRFYDRPDVVPFPEIDERFINELKARADLIETGNLHSKETLARVRNCSADYILLAGTPVIKRELYELTKHETLNRHEGLSPDYRGTDCPIWVMSQDQFDMIGFTIHLVTDRVDGGQIIHQKTVEISRGLDFSQALAHISRQASEAFIDVLAKIVHEVELTSEDQGTGGKHFPPATWSALRAAKKNYHRRYSERNVA